MDQPLTEKQRGMINAYRASALGFYDKALAEAQTRQLNRRYPAIGLYSATMIKIAEHMLDKAEDVRANGTPSEREAR